LLTKKTISSGHYYSSCSTSHLRRPARKFFVFAYNFSSLAVGSAKSGTFGTRLTLKGSSLASFGTMAGSARPPVFYGETAGVARIVPLWLTFAKQGRHPPRRFEQTFSKDRKRDD
jgi:hypothetical protein